MSNETKTKIDQQRRNMMIGGAKRFSAANKSDPFAMRRAMTHINNGIAEPFVKRGDQLIPAFYDAKEGVEHRSVTRADGSTLNWDATVYNSISQPCCFFTMPKLNRLGMSKTMN